MFIVSGFRFGFHLGVHDPKLISAEKNNKSSYDHEDKVNMAILKELNRGHTVGPLAKYTTFIQFSLSTTVQTHKVIAQWDWVLQNIYFR